jgi:peptidyl-tRNA hydrolase, PTH1 family
MVLIAGLGNPGATYTHTRHNVGFMAIDVLARAQQDSWSLSTWSESEKFNALIADGRVGDMRVVLCKPQTFMNRSGESVRTMAAWHDISPAHIIVLHDEIDLPFGEIRIQEDRGAAGHNGVQSLIDELGTQSFARVRIGVGRPEGQLPVDAFVLQNFSTIEKAEIDRILAGLPAIIESHFFTKKA